MFPLIPGVPRDPAAGLRRTSVVVVAIGTFGHEVGFNDLARNGWSKGPLPLSLARTSSTAVATPDRRRTYIDNHVAHVVLGGTDHSWRAHRRVPDPAPNTHGTTVWAVELVRLDLRTDTQPGPAQRQPESSVERDVQFAMILHASANAAGRSLAQVLAGVRQVDPRQPPDGLGIGRFTIPSERGDAYVFRMVLATRADHRMPSLSKRVVSTRQAEHWAFTLASATLPRERSEGLVPDFDPDDDYLAAQFSDRTFMALSADWRVGVLRSGAAFIGMTADPTASLGDLWSSSTKAVSRGGYFDSAELYVRTIYVDVFLLGLVQRHAVHRLRERVRRASIGTADVSKVRWIGREVARFKEQYWWDDVSRGGPGDLLLRAFHEQHGLANIVAKIERDTETLVERVQLDAERRKSDALTGLSLLAPASLGLGILAVAIGVLRFWLDPPHHGNPRLWASAIAAVAGLVPLLIWLSARRAGRGARRRWERWE